MFIRLCCLVLSMVCAAGLSARADDFRLRSTLRPDVARQTSVTETGNQAMAFFCVISCERDIFDRIADADISLDLTDARQMEILYSNLVGILMIPPFGTDSGAAQSAPPDRGPLSPVDAIIASRAAHPAPTNGPLH